MNGVRYPSIKNLKDLKLNYKSERYLSMHGHKSAMIRFTSRAQYCRKKYVAILIYSLVY